MSKNKPTEKLAELKIISKPLALAVDGNGITIHDTNTAELLFFQITKKLDGVIEAQGVANLRFSLPQLKALKDLLEKVIAEHESKTEKNK